MTEALPELTDRQRQVYEFIEARIEEWGYPPTIREIGEHLCIKSTNGVADHVKALVNGIYTRRCPLEVSLRHGPPVAGRKVRLSGAGSRRTPFRRAGQAAQVCASCHHTISRRQARGFFKLHIGSDSVEVV